MRGMLLVLVLTIASVLPVCAGDLPETRLKDLVKKAADGSLTEISSEVTPGTFEARPLVEQVVLDTGTGALSSLVALGDKSPLKKTVSAEVWERLVKARPVVDPVADAMGRALHDTVAKAIAAKNIDASRLLVGTANLYLRQSSEADGPVEAAIDLYVADAAARVVGQPDLQAALLALSVDPKADPEVRQRAGYLYSLNADTAARAKVAVLQFQETLGGGR